MRRQYWVHPTAGFATPQNAIIDWTRQSDTYPSAVMWDEYDGDTLIAQGCQEVIGESALDGPYRLGGTSEYWRDR